MIGFRALKIVWKDADHDQQEYKGTENPMQKGARRDGGSTNGRRGSVIFSFVPMLVAMPAFRNV